MTDAIEWPPEAREAVARIIEAAYVNGCNAGGASVAADALAALAPFVAAREAAAFQRGAETMREACAECAASEAEDWRKAGVPSREEGALQIRNMLRALPIPEQDTTP